MKEKSNLLSSSNGTFSDTSSINSIAPPKPKSTQLWTISCGIKPVLLEWVAKSWEFNNKVEKTVIELYINYMKL